MNPNMLKSNPETYSQFRNNIMKAANTSDLRKILAEFSTNEIDIRSLSTPDSEDSILATFTPTISATTTVVVSYYAC
ncbi:hypothetical protein JD969_17965 [Planctomycetota bacterium]|nr:hypothetical protein JD969_17965 [Planctomycetota bacterium]